jgi:Ras-related protein Rab-1A
VGKKVVGPYSKMAVAHYDYLYKIFIEGDYNVGKSSLLARIGNDTFNNNNTYTVGIDFKLRTLELDSNTIKVRVWDKVGSERFRSFTTLHYRGHHGYFVVYDVTDRDTFRSVPRWLENVIRYSEEDVAILVIGNKSDMEGQRVVSFEEGKALADEFGVRFIETSAKDSANVEAAFMALVVEIKARIEACVLHYEGRRLSSREATKGSVCY